MQRITREAIRRMASSETVYYRGMRYYAAHAVSDVTWNENAGQYRSVVHGGNQYVVTIQVSEEGEWLYTCNCPSHVKRYPWHQYGCIDGIDLSGIDLSAVSSGDEEAAEKGSCLRGDVSGRDL